MAKGTSIHYKRDFIEIEIDFIEIEILERVICVVSENEWWPNCIESKEERLDRVSVVTLFRAFSLEVNDLRLGRSITN